jgi:hypothetical protein
MPTVVNPRMAGVIAAAPQILAQSAIPFILAGGTAGGSSNQFTMGNNGALSTLAVLPTTYSGGAFIYMPANGIFAGSTAGWYWFVASSTTAGTVYNNQYTSGDPRLAVPATPAPFASTGPGLVTQTTAADLTAHQITIPGGSLGPSGRVRTLNNVLYTSVGTQNVWSAFFGGAQYMGQGLAVNSPSVGAQAVPVSVMNMNSQTRQYVNNYAGDAISSGSLSPGYLSVNTANDVVVQTALRIGNAQGFCIFQGVMMEILYGA